jgi:hypothetical protein
MTKDTQVSPTALPTADAIAGWKKECERIGAEIRSLERTRNSLMALVQAAQNVVSKAAPASAPTRERRPLKSRKATRVRKARPLLRPRRTGRKSGGLSEGSWTSTINTILVKVGRRVTYEELREELRKTPIADKLNRSDKGFYGAIAKLLDRKHIVKHKGWLFAAEAYKRFMDDVAHGRVTDDEAPRLVPPSPFGEAIAKFLGTRGSYATSAHIINELCKNPEFAATIERNPTHVYNVLSRLVAQGRVKKHGKLYRIIRSKESDNGSPAAPTVNSSADDDDALFTVARSFAWKDDDRRPS